MITCNYCRNTIRNPITLVTIQVGNETIHLHSDQDRADGDCAGLMTVAIEATRGNRPPVKPAT